MTSEWQVFGEQASVSYEVMADVGRALMGNPPRHHEWVKFNEDRTAYQVGPHVAEEPQS